MGYGIFLRKKRKKLISQNDPILPPVGTPLEDWTWEQISYVSNFSNPAAYFSLGDEKTININGEETQIRIIGFNHDYLVEPILLPDGNYKMTAGITFETVNFIDTHVYNLTTEISRPIDQGTDEIYNPFDYLLPYQQILSQINSQFYTQQIPLKSVYKSVYGAIYPDQPYQDNIYKEQIINAQTFMLSAKEYGMLEAYDYDYSYTYDAPYGYYYLADPSNRIKNNTNYYYLTRSYCRSSGDSYEDPETGAIRGFMTDYNYYIDFDGHIVNNSSIESGYVSIGFCV